MSTDDTDVIPVVKGDEEDEHTGAWWWISRIVSYTLLAAMLTILAATVVIPRVSGSTPYTILTSSMRPTYPPGTLVVDVTPDGGLLYVHCMYAEDRATAITELRKLDERLQREVFS